MGCHVCNENSKNWMNQCKMADANACCKLPVSFIRCDSRKDKFYYAVKESQEWRPVPLAYLPGRLMKAIMVKDVTSFVVCGSEANGEPRGDSQSFEFDAFDDSWSSGSQPSASTYKVRLEQAKFYEAHDHTVYYLLRITKR